MKNQYKVTVGKKKRKLLSMQMRHRLREGFFVLTVTGAIFLLISLCSYHATDPGWSSTGIGGKIVNWGGKVGAWLADVFLSLFGVVAFIFPLMMMVSGWLRLQDRDQLPRKSYEWMLSFFGWLFLITSCCGLASYHSLAAHTRFPSQSGGIIGDLLGTGLAMLFNQTGSVLLFIATLLCGITLVSGFSWLAMIELIGEKISVLFANIWARLPAHSSLFSWIARIGDKPANATVELPKPLRRDDLIKQRQEMINAEQANRESNKVDDAARQEPSISLAHIPPAIAQQVVVRAPESTRDKKKIEIESKVKMAPGTLPPLMLLNESSKITEAAFTSVSLDDLSQMVEQRLDDFGVDVKVVGVYPGPIVTRFELDLAPGIKVSKITGLAKDIARSLSAVSVRVVEVIPGKSVIGLEIPNEHREMVTFRDMVESTQFRESTSPVSLVLGKDISGTPMVVDLMKMPHLLVAGTTGSGKSVSINAMLLSMLYKATPDQLRLILIDPKMLELSIYDGIPHLLTPVITDMKNASNALRWCVAEMDRRYRLMAALGVRNVAGYNQKVTDAIEAGEPLLMPTALVTDAASAQTELETLPMIVVVADELADMMMVVGKKVEDLIARIAQKARAAGIHLILATQRPSVDVITGLIKANIPTRIAFQVSSRIDSRTILDQQGAEQLLGHGDMLYLQPGAGVPVRVHGAYVADEEVHRVVAAWRTYGEPDYIYEVTDDASDAEGSGDGQGTGEQDALYDEAVRIVTESRRASISLVQRRLRIGYNRAARIMEDMEAAGIVSVGDGSGAREVLVGDTVDV